MYLPLNIVSQQEQVQSLIFTLKLNSSHRCEITPKCKNGIIIGISIANIKLANFIFFDTIIPVFTSFKKLDN